MDIDQSATFYNVSLTSKEFPGLATEMKYTAYIIACTSITCRQSDGVGICKCVPSVLPILFPFLCLISRPLHNSSSFLCSLLFPLSFLFAFSICISPQIFHRVCIYRDDIIFSSCAGSQRMWRQLSYCELHSQNKGVSLQQDGH